MPRPRKHSAEVQREIYLPVAIAATLETLFFDPMRGKARYNAINVYVNALIAQDLRKRGLFPGAVQKPLDSGGGTGHNDPTNSEITGDSR
jgi:hypothetical protein